MTTENEYVIVIRQTVTVEHRVPFNSKTYPGCKTPQEAAEFERNRDYEEKLEIFTDEVSMIEDHNFGESITVESVQPPKVKYQIPGTRIVRLEDDNYEVGYHRRSAAEAAGIPIKEDVLKRSDEDGNQI